MEDLLNMANETEDMDDLDQYLNSIHDEVLTDWEHEAANEVEVGDDVFFVGTDGVDRPAKVVAHWSGDMVNLFVFLDGTNDRIYGGYTSSGPNTPTLPIMASWQTSVHWAHPRDKTPRSWHY